MGKEFVVVPIGKVKALMELTKAMKEFIDLIGPHVAGKMTRDEFRALVDIGAKAHEAEEDWSTLYTGNGS